MKLNYVKARKIVRILHIAAVPLLILFIIMRNMEDPSRSQTLIAWIVGFGGVILVSIISFPISWKYLRCPKCTHMIPAFYKEGRDFVCPTCRQGLKLDADGNLQIREDWE